MFFKLFSGSQPDEGTQEILRKLEEPSTKQNVKTVQGGVLIDMENADTYGKNIGANYVVVVNLFQLFTGFHK